MDPRCLLLDQFWQSYSDTGKVMILKHIFQIRAYVWGLQIIEKVYVSYDVSLNTNLIAI